jgi:hypothetical protein
MGWGELQLKEKRNAVNVSDMSCSARRAHLSINLIGIAHVKGAAKDEEPRKTEAENSDARSGAGVGSSVSVNNIMNNKRDHG